MRAGAFCESPRPLRFTRPDRSACPLSIRVSTVAVPQKPTRDGDAGAGLWKGLGMWSWILFRISGVVLVLYLVAHLWVISQGRIGGPESLDSLFETLDRPFLVFLDLMLVAAVLYHALNGVRVILMDFGVGVRSHKAIFWVCMFLAASALGLFAFKASSFILG